ncbi:phage tail protein [Acinetobacter guerrae]|uniref:phage tail protein n=1 Tax=Acinetobacter guerrae TaxID=1843371 RepID=UPI00128CADB3|nr:phage tail protein [Acinetobacter guerrae]MPW44788.1 hypothetical protein [Acinetobacter guerrae]
MGGSSKQTTGHKYFATFVGMLGNCIEGIWGWNFDNRGWIRHPKGELIKAGKFRIDRDQMYGETEGGIAGFVDIKDGSPDQLQNDVYAAHLEQNGMPPVAYRYLSYLVYENFYWGNNPFMKEILVWPKRIHKKFDGSGQWYDEKAEIGRIYGGGGSGYEYRTFPVSMSGQVSWNDPNGSHVAPWSSGEFPFFETQQSYNNGGGKNGPPLDVDPSYSAAQPVLNEHGIVIDGGTVVPPCTWESYPPVSDGGWNGSIVRNFSFEGFFEWRASYFDYKAVLSMNNASVSIYKRNESGAWTGVHIISADWGGGFAYTEGKIFLGSGFYKIIASMGERYLSTTTPRPFVHLLVKYKATDEYDLPAADINPIHKIREILTDYTALNKPESDIDEDNFKIAADRIYEEGLGISYAIQEAKCIDVLNDICSHIEGAVRINRQTGKYQAVLFRDDWFDLEQAQSFDEKSIKTFEAEITNADGPVNVLNINYYDRANIKNSSFNLADVGSIHTIGGEISQTVDFPYFMNRRNAEMVANWKLKQLSTGAWKGTFTTGKYEARKINRYDVIKISFAKRGIVDLLVRVMNIKLGNGRDNTVSIDFVEVVPYSGQNFASITIDPPVDNDLSPQPTEPTIFEMPYYEAVQQFGQSQVDLELANNPELGYLTTAAQKPQNNSLNALLYTDGGTGVYTNFERVSSLNYCQELILDQSIGYLDTTFAVDDTDYVKQRNVPKFQNTEFDTIIQLNNELMSFVSYNTETKIITVKRGVLDTVPQKHTGGRLVFWGESLAYDKTQYVRGENLQAQVLTTTPSAVQLLDIQNVIELEIDARAIRPYPPANVKINGQYWPEDEINTDLNIEWVDRNRIQQTGGSLLSFNDGGVAIESGVTYRIDLYDSDTNALLDSQVNIVSPASVPKSKMAINNRIELFSVRDGYDSYQGFIYNFIKSATELWTPDYLEKLIWLDANNETPDSNGKIFAAHDKSGNGFDFLSSGGMLIQNDSLISSNYFISNSGGLVSSALAASNFNGKRFAYMFMIINESESIEGYFYNIGRRRLEFGSYRLSFQRYVVQTHQQESDGYLSAWSPKERKINVWKMLLVQVDLQTGIKIFIDDKVDTNFESTSSRSRFSDSDGSSIIFMTNSSSSVRCAAMLTGNSDITLDRPKLFGWAAHKYGLTANLPEDHPYKNQPPLV